MATLIRVIEDGPLTTYYYAENVVMVENAETGSVTARKLPDPMVIIRGEMLRAYADAPRHDAEVSVDD
jgi:hypothetical protein